ncbi:hypothetical protein LR48_Vigan03g220300 [Vigna angularis]|uniref:Uncharacterized protein n=1 Tax=Phaseolus angularis TaxID=3914 RepID=A0A0L9U7V9_PHAAN|nr:hypothetical protein LR48_Vigan03g220300 [Vigna angularis]
MFVVNLCAFIATNGNLDRFCYWVPLFTPLALTDQRQLHWLDAGTIISALYSLWGFMQISPQHRCLLLLFILSFFNDAVSPSFFKS